MTRHGALLVFKPGLDPAQAAAALKSLEAVLDPDYFSAGAATGFSRTVVRSSDGAKTLTAVETFNDEYGGPVFYIP